MSGSSKRSRKRNAPGESGAPPKSRTLTVPGHGDVSRDRAIALIATSPSTTAATLSVDYSRATFGELSLTDTMAVLSETLKAVRQGSLAEVENILMAQAVALNSIFTDLSVRAARAEYVDGMERYLRLGLKAQGQCRATLETLAAIKNPPLVVTRQANISNGPQQVNNGVTAQVAPSRAEGSETAPNELLGERYGEWLDSGTESATARSDSSMAPLGEVDGATKRPR